MLECIHLASEHDLPALKRDRAAPLATASAKSTVAISKDVCQWVACSGVFNTLENLFVCQVLFASNFIQHSAPPTFPFRRRESENRAPGVAEVALLIEGPNLLGIVGKAVVEACGCRDISTAD